MARKRLQLPIRDLFSGLLPDEAALPEQAAVPAPAVLPAALSASLSASIPTTAPTTASTTTHSQPELETLAPEPTQALEPTQTVASEECRQIFEARLWCDRGWTARVIKNEEEEGWAVAMTQDGESEPALISPWTMGRDKKNPKPLDAQAFHSLVKSAGDVLRRHQQQFHAQLHKTLSVDTDEGEIRITLDIVPDDDDPYAVLSAFDADEQQLATVRVAANFKLDLKSASRWIEKDYRTPDSIAF
jgi:hypothetical protein